MDYAQSLKSSQACNITMSLHEPLDIIEINIMSNKAHPTLGLNLDKNLTVISCIPGTPAAKIKGWRQTIKNTVLHSINGVTLSTLNEVKHELSLHLNMITLQFKTRFQPTLHPETGTTQITFDQFVSIAEHQKAIRKNEGTVQTINKEDIDPVVTSQSSVNSLTRGKLIKQKDWDE